MAKTFSICQWLFLICWLTVDCIGITLWLRLHTTHCPSELFPLQKNRYHLKYDIYHVFSLKLFKMDFNLCGNYVTVLLNTFNTISCFSFIWHDTINHVCKHYLDWNDFLWELMPSFGGKNGCIFAQWLRFVLNYESSQAENSYFENSEKGSRAWQKCPSWKSKHFVLIPCSPITFLIYILVRCLLGMLLLTYLSDRQMAKYERIKVFWDNPSWVKLNSEKVSQGQTTQE